MTALAGLSKVSGRHGGEILSSATCVAMITVPTKTISEMANLHADKLLALHAHKQCNPVKQPVLNEQHVEMLVWSFTLVSFVSDGSCVFAALQSQATHHLPKRCHRVAAISFICIASW